MAAIGELITAATGRDPVGYYGWAQLLSAASGSVALAADAAGIPARQFARAPTRRWSTGRRGCRRADREGRPYDFHQYTPAGPRLRHRGNVDRSVWVGTADELRLWHSGRVRPPQPDQFPLHPSTRPPQAAFFMPERIDHANSRLSVLARFSEPSSYAGLGAVLALAGWNLSDTTLGQIVQLCAAGCGLLALFLKERGLVRMIALTIAAAPMLTGCGGLVAAGSAAGAAASALALANQVSGTVDTVIQTACSEYQTGKSAANAVVGTGLVPASIAGKVTSIEGFGDAACANPPAGDPVSTAIWLGELVGQITTLTSGAKAGG